MALQDEPAPCPVDSWARGVLDCSSSSYISPSSLQPSFVQGSTLSSTSPSASPPSHPSYPAKASSQSQTKPFTTPGAAKANLPHSSAFQKAVPKQAVSTLPPQATKPSRSSPSPIRASTTGNSTTTTTTTNRSTDPKPPSKVPTIAANTTKDTSKSKQQQQQQQEGDTERFAKLKRDIRNREYSYDHNGNLVIISQADYDKFPSSKANMKVNIISTPAEPSPTSAGNMTSKPPGSPQRTFSTGRKKQQDHKPSLASAPSNKHYKEIKLTQPPMMDSSVKIAPGVTLHPAERKKDNSTAPSPPRALRKKEPPPPQPPQHHPHPPKTTEPMLPAIPVPNYSQPTTLTLSPTALYGSTQKMWTTEMLSENFNALLPSLKPRTPSSNPPFSGFT